MKLISRESYGEKAVCLQRAFPQCLKTLVPISGDQEQCIIYYTEAKEAATYFKHSSFLQRIPTIDVTCAKAENTLVSSVTVIWRVCVKFVGTKLVNIKPGQSRSQKPWEKRN